MSGFRWIEMGAFIVALAIVAGAFGAHGLESHFEKIAESDPQLAARRLDNWKTAAEYQVYEGVGLVLVGLLMLRCPHWLLTASAWCHLLGAMIFCGMLYALVLTEVRVLGAIVPIGGVSMISGWVCFFLGSWFVSRQQEQ